MKQGAHVLPGAQIAEGPLMLVRPGSVAMSETRKLAAILVADWSGPLDPDSRASRN